MDNVMDAHVLLATAYLTGVIVPAKGLLALLAPVGAIVGLMLLSGPWAEYVNLSTAPTTESSFLTRLIKTEHSSTLFAFLIDGISFSSPMLTSIGAILSWSLCFKKAWGRFCECLKGIVAVFCGTDFDNSRFYPGSIGALQRAKPVFFSLRLKLGSTMFADFYHADSLSQNVKSVKHRRIL